MFITFVGHASEYVGEQAQDYVNEYLQIKQANSLEFKGRVACAGHAVGKAKIIRNPSQFGKLQKGDVLVVGNTSPDFVPILQRAIVAEEGGLTAHVSVVSREFGIPCIVGIGRITEILRDGDMLEVDAKKGIVKVIK